VRPTKSTIKAMLAPHPGALRSAAKVYGLSNAFRAYFRRAEHDFLRDVAALNPDVFFLQIGAHDGKTDDHVHFFVRNHGWKGILVEPVGELFRRLLQNYEGITGLVFENAALAEEDGSRPFYRVRKSTDPDWCSQLGSFRRDVVLSHKYVIPGIEHHVVEERVRCISLQSLMTRHRVSRLDVVVIDTEGYDLQILRQIDLARYRPQLVIYEQKHLSPTEKREAIQLLKRHGYRVHRIGVGWNNAATRNG
jgi:FkbM family methyltransferase